MGWLLFTEYHLGPARGLAPRKAELGEDQIGCHPEGWTDQLTIEWAGHSQCWEEDTESDIRKGVLPAASGVGRASWKGGVAAEPQRRKEREKVEGRASQAGTEFHTGRCGQWMLMTVDISWGLSLRWALECFNSHNQPWEVGMILFCSSKTGP